MSLRAGLEPIRHRQALGAKEVRVEELRLVARAVVAEHRHDPVPRPQVARHADRPGDVDPGRRPHAEALLAQELEDERHRLRVGDAVGHVDAQALEVRGDPPLADALGHRRALGLQRAVRVVVPERRAFRVGEPDPHRGRAGAQPLGDAGERAAGAHRADEAVDAPVHLLPDLGRRALHMRLSVHDVVELVRPDRAVRIARRDLLGKPARIAHVVVGVAVRHRRHLDELGAREADHILLFLALGLRDHDDGAKPHRGADQRQPDPGIAGGPLDDGPARPELPARHRVADDPERRPVLDRLAGVHELRLAPDLAARGLGGTAQPDQRGASHGRRQVRRNDHRLSPCPAGSRPD